MSDAPRLEVVVYGTPAPQGSKQGFVNRHTGRVSMVESSAKVKPWREAVKHAAIEELGVQLRPVFRGAVYVTGTFYLPRPKGHYRTGRNAALLRDAAPLFPIGKPDLDKLTRSTMDALGDAGVWRDDAQVVCIMLSKAYADGRPPGAKLTVVDYDHDDGA